jgi:DNA-binding NtrC family response regulator
VTRGRVLLVDDEPILRLTLGNDLTEEGYEVTCASDGGEGLRLIQMRGFDVALLDLKLPRVDGLALLQGFKAANPQGLAIMMTAYGTIQSAVAAMKKGATDYLLKPFPSEELLTLLRGLLAQKKGARRKRSSRNACVDSGASSTSVNRWPGSPTC